MLRFLSNMAGLFLVLIVGLMLVGGMQAKAFWSEKWTVVSAWIEQSGKAVESFPDNIGLPSESPKTVTAEEDVEKATHAPDVVATSKPTAIEVVAPEPIQERPSHATGAIEDPVPTQVMKDIDVSGVAESDQEQNVDRAEPAEIEFSQSETPFVNEKADIKRFTESEKRQFEAEASEFGERALQAFNNIDTVLGRN